MYSNSEFSDSDENLVKWYDSFAASRVNVGEWLYNSYRINGCSVLGGTSTEILSVVQDCLTQQSSFQPIVTLNVMMFPEYDRDAKLFDWLKESAMFTPDGISMSLSILKSILHGCLGILVLIWCLIY